MKAEYKKNPFEDVAAAPKKTVKASDSMSSVSAASFNGLPCEDISANITPNLLKNLGSPDRKKSFESLLYGCHGRSFSTITQYSEGDCSTCPEYIDARVSLVERERRLTHPYKDLSGNGSPRVGGL